MPIQKVLETS